MKKPSLIQISCLLVSVLLLSCATPEVKISARPIANSPAAKRELLNSSSMAVLQRDGLRELYRSDPDSALRKLHQRYKSDGGADRLAAVAELCVELGVDRELSAPTAAVGCYLDAARLSRAAAFRSDGAALDREMRLIYNVSCASLASVLFNQSHDWSIPAHFDGPIGGSRLSLGHAAKGDISHNFFDALIPTDRIILKNIELERKFRKGVGGSMVGHHAQNKKGGPSEKFVGDSGLDIPVNALLNFPNDTQAVLVLRDLLKVDAVQVSGESVPLAADWSVAVGYLYRDAPKGSIGFMGMLRPDKYSAMSGLFLLERFDPDKIPLILVHGLMSSAETWINLINQFLSDPVLRHRYQVVLFQYPTGYSIGFNGRVLRKNLAEFQDTFDPKRRNPNMRKMVVVCHSMGGNLTDLQIRNSGNALVNLNFVVPIADLDTSAKKKKDLESLLVFTANPDIERVIYLATPHRGSKISVKWFARLGSRVIRLPGQLLSSTTSELSGLSHLTPIGEKQLTEKHDSLISLHPSNPNFPVILQMPVGKGTTYHSIIGQVNQSKPIIKGDDKVVWYRSSHLTGAASEKIVDASHTHITHNPAAINEVHRLLYLHIDRKYGDE